MSLVIPRWQLPLNLAIMISGSGTTMREIILGIRYGELRGLYRDPPIIIASKDGIGGLTLAANLGIPESNIYIYNPKNYISDQEAGQVLLEIMASRGINVFIQAGFLPTTPRYFIENFWGKGLNQHPVPLDPGYPDFGGQGMHGKYAHAALLEYYRLIGVDAIWTEATSHYVAAEVDKGEVIYRQKVRVARCTPEALSDLMLPFEWATQKEALRLVALGLDRPLVRNNRLIVPGTEHHLLAAKKYAAGLKF